MYMTKPLQQGIYQETAIWATHKRRERGLEHLNFFNKVISELLAVDVKIDEEDKVLILLSSLPEYMIILSLPCSTVRKLSSWRRSRQLSYLMRLEKGQIKRSIQDRVWWSQEEKEEEKEKRSKLIKGVSLLSHGRSLKK